MIFSRKPTDDQFRAVIESVVNPQVVALRKEFTALEQRVGIEIFKANADCISVLCKDIKALYERISKLETAPITAKSKPKKGRGGKSGRKS